MEGPRVCKPGSCQLGAGKIVAAEFRRHRRLGKEDIPQDCLLAFKH